MTSASSSELAIGVSPEQRAALAALLANKPLESVLAMLCFEGEAARVVGGAVRNTLMGVSVTDVDIATTCLPHETMRRAVAAGFKAIPTGIAHGTVTVVVQGQAFEITTLREDMATDGRHATVRFGRDFVADAHRRDFTMNALMLSGDGFLHDHVGGMADLAAGRVRFIGDAKARITEDYLRILRFFRFHASYGTGQLDAAGLDACVMGQAGLDGLSAERIRNELMKLLMATGATASVRLMSDAGIWQRVTGGIALPARLTQMLSLLPQADEPQRLAAVAVLTTGDAERLRLRLKLSNVEHEALIAAAKAFEVVYGEPAPDDKISRRMSYQLGYSPFMLAMACLNKGLDEAAFAALSQASRTPQFLLSGRDVLALGVAAGPLIGQVLASAEALWAQADFLRGKAEQLDLLPEAINLISGSHHS